MAFRDKDGYLLQSHFEFPLERVKQALEEWRDHPNDPAYETHMGLCWYFDKRFEVPYQLTHKMLVCTGIIGDNGRLGSYHNHEARYYALKRLVKMNKGRKYIQSRKPVGKSK